MSRVLTDDGYRDKIKSLIVVTASGCWEWQGYRHLGNYGQMYYRGKQQGVHRTAYLLWVGPIPAGMGVLHKCDNKPCVNPDHLFLGDQRSNGRDLRDKGLHYSRLRTHCRQGHAYAEYGRIDRRGFRQCRMCSRIHQRIKAGWPEDLARSLPYVSKGHRPVGGKFLRKRGPRPVKTHCKYGHELAGDNLYLAPDGKRRCRKCQVRTVSAVMKRWADGETATQRLSGTSTAAQAQGGSTASEAAVAPLK